MKKLLCFELSILFILFISADSKNVDVYRSRYIISSICAHTEYKQTCIATLSPLVRRHKMTPRDILYATISGVIQALKNDESSFDGVVGADDEVIRDCHEYVGFAYDDLHNSLNLVEKYDLPGIIDRKSDLMSWLSAVIAEQETCLDEFEYQPELRKTMSNVLSNSSQQIFNALSITHGFPFPKIFKRSYIPIPTVGGRWLPGNDERSYPRWMSKP